MILTCPVFMVGWCIMSQFSTDWPSKWNTNPIWFYDSTSSWIIASWRGCWNKKMLRKIWVLALIGILSVASINAQDEVQENSVSFKVHIFWEGHKILRNLHLTFVLCSASQIYSGYFAKVYGLLRIYEL